MQDRKERTQAFGAAAIEHEHSQLTDRHVVDELTTAANRDSSCQPLTLEKVSNCQATTQPRDATARLTHPAADCVPFPHHALLTCTAGSRRHQENRKTRIIIHLSGNVNSSTLLYTAGTDISLSRSMTQTSQRTTHAPHQPHIPHTTSHHSFITGRMPHHSCCSSRL